MSLIFQAFTGTIRAWRRGTEVLEGITHGEFAVNKLSNALNSTLYFYNPKKNYAFTFEKGNHMGLPADTLSFITVSSAFMPKDSPFEKGPHRLKIYIDTDDQGDPALFAMALPALATEDDFEDEYNPEPYLISHEVQGLEIFVYDKENEDWTEEWEKENAVPERIKINIYIASDDEEEEPLIFTRVIDIPVAPSVKNKLTGPSSSANTEETPPTQTPPSGGNSPSTPSIKPR